MSFDFRLPEYLRSTDFKAFEALYKIMFGAIKKDIDGITDLKDVDKCAEHMLPVLADFIGCPYFSETTPAVNRLIIKNWWWLMKNKGTIQALQTAASLGLIAFDSARGLFETNVMYARTIELVLDNVSGEIFIRVAYQQLGESETEVSKVEQQRWMQRLVEYVRPAGFKITFVPSQFTKAFINILTSHDIRIVKMNYEVQKHSALTDGIYFDYDIEDANIPEECIARFGHYSDKDDPSNPCLYGSCPYTIECKEYTESGVGQQEISGLDGEERYEP